MKNLMKLEDFLKIKDDKEFVLLDCRFNLSDKEYGKKAFNEGHIKGAMYVDLETELTGEVKEHGGRHPLPNLKNFTKDMNKKFVDDDIDVIIYDDGDLAAASRLWWIFKYIGKENVYILEEGIKAWKDRNLPLEQKQTINSDRTVGNLSLNIKDDMYCDIQYVKDNLDTVFIMDVREEERYLGDGEPVDKKAGHIPGAKNYFWKDNFNDFKVKPKEELKELLKGLKEKETIIVHCGSGITGSVSVMILDELGIKAKLYGGSWSDWISYDENPIVVGEER
ncbi:sulfurtransferase [Clostridium algidicarnis]|uniref:Thiosulfate/3-mercaptopyruvate sulfurtransferase n=1 Tax=Clostridium algidicarnis DSM 15099 TaxID=1121295 RepID=A0A2S6FWY3_9CLOT|nr:sulfurtransferase [Clostridium algidicarnis]PPK47979.1 thiosulfate/3-mercaptopyruvate sulfurtransferase [Clostridium algidicarnis DSM 15099]